MRTEYLYQLEQLIVDCQISYKSVFGAVGAYAIGHIFMTYGKFGVALKLADETCSSRMAEGAGKPLEYFEKRFTKQNYAVLSGTLLKDRARTGNLLL